MKSCRCEILPALLLAMMVVLSGCNRTTPLSPQTEASQDTSSSPDVTSEQDEIDRISHQKMLATLKAINDEAEENHPFFGRRPLLEAQAAFDRFGGTAGPLDKSTMHGVLGQELLKLGRSKEAISHMEKAVGLLEKHSSQVPSDVLQRATFLLAVGHLRDAENVNCVNCLNGERCVFPVKGGGIHDDLTGSEQAVKHLERALEMDPNDLGARWLLNIAYMTLGQYPGKVPTDYLIPPERFEGEPSPLGPFPSIANQLGLNALGCAGSVIVDDFDGDVDLDILFSNWATDGQLKYFRNDGTGKFSEQTEAANLSGIFGGLNLIQGDYDNDGDIDALVLRGAWLEQVGRHPVSLLRNDGKARFIDVTFAVGLGDHSFPTQTANWSDYDLDGDLDLFIGNEGYPAELYQNNGKGMFRNVAAEAGVNDARLTKGTAMGDYNGDDWPDIYMSNLPGENRLYRNNQDGTFTDVAAEAGVLGPTYSFPTWFWDFNNDGLLDLYVASFEFGIRHVARDYMGLPPETELDHIYVGTKSGKFEERAVELGFTRATQPMGSNFGDLDNDGFLDFYLGTGYVDYEGLIPNLLFYNHRGRAFKDITFDARVGHLQKGHGVAFADFDQDGDQDLIAVMGGWYPGDAFARVVFENPGNKGNWLVVRLKGEKSNRFGVGSRIRATFQAEGEERSIYRWVNSGGSFGANPLYVHLGVGSADKIKELEVYWPASKRRQLFTDVPAKQYIEVNEMKDQYQSRDYRALR